MKEGPTRSREQQHELRQRRSTSKKLEDDNKKMELRLQELKLAMNKEREERQSKEGGFWGKGQTGTLLNYKVDTSKKQSSKVKRVGVLKDEVIVAPKRPAQPGTMAFIAQQDPAGRTNRTSQKVKATKCGQCEDKSAAVTCQECGEDYCTKCFAVFHLKGALRKHRTIPITSMTPRSSSARQLFVHQTSTDNGTSEKFDRPAALINQMMRQDEVGPVEAESVAGGPFSKQPESARDEARQMIQEMMQTQQRKISQESNETPRQESAPARATTKPTVHFDEDFDELYFAHDIGVGSSARFDYPLRSQRQQVEVSDCKIGFFLSEMEGTDDPVSRILLGQHPNRETEKPAPEINFTQTLSYGERLMLRQHRRKQLDQIQDGYIELQQPIRREDELRSLARQQALQTKFNNQLAEDFPDLEDDDRIDFQALCDLSQMAMNTNNSHEPPAAMVLDTAFVDRVEVREDDFTPRIRPPTQENRRRMSNNNASSLARLRRYQPPKPVQNKETAISKPSTEVISDSRLLSAGGVKTGMSMTVESVTPTSGARVTPSPVPRLPSGSSRRPRMTPTPRSARRIPEVPRPVSRRSDSAQRVHNLITQPTDRLRAVLDQHRSTPLDTWMALDFSDSQTDQMTSLSTNRPVSVRSDRPSSARSRPGTTSQLSNRFYSIGPRAWRPDNSVASEDLQRTQEESVMTTNPPNNLLSFADPDQPSEDFSAEIDAIEALARVQKETFAAPAMTQSSQGPKMALRGLSLSSFRATSRASTTLTAVTSESIDSECLTGRQSIVIEGDDYSSYDQLRNDEDESDDDNAHILALEGEMSFTTGGRSRLHEFADEESSKSSNQYQLEDSLEFRRSLSVNSEDSDSLDSLDTARYDDAGDVRDLQ